MTLLIGAFLLTLPLVVLPGNDDPSSLPQAAWLQIAVPLLWSAWFATRDPRSRLPRPTFLWPLGLFLAWSALSILWVDDAFAAVQVLLRWSAAAGLGALVARSVTTLPKARRLLATLFWASVLVSVAGLLQHLGGWDGIPQAFPPAGTLSNKNVAAGFVAAMTPLGVLAFANAATPAMAAILAVSVGSTLAFVFHAGCRSADLALVIQFLAGVWLMQRYGLEMPWTRARRVALTMGVIAFVLLMLMAPPAAGPLLPIPHLQPNGSGTSPADVVAREQRAASSAAIRLGVWRHTIEMIRSAPWFGSGLGSFEARYPRFASAGVDGIAADQKVESAHNDYLQLAAEQGLLGAALFTWVVVASLRTGAAAFREGGPHARAILSAAALAFTGLLVHAAFFPTAQQPAALAAAATFAGIVGQRSERDLANPAPGPVRAGSALIARLGLASSLLVFLIMSARGLAQIRADRHILEMARAEIREDWPLAAREGLVARRLNPGRVDSRFGTASALLRLGRPAEAARLLEELVAAQPHNANALGNLGIAYGVQGDLSRAASCFERLLRLRPEDEVARRNLRYLQSQTTVAPKDRSMP